MFSIFFSVITHFYEILQYNFEDISPNLSYRTKAYKANKCLWTKQRRVGQSVWLDMWRTGCAEQQGNHSWPQQRVQSVEDSSKQIKREMWRRAAKSDGFQAWGAELEGWILRRSSGDDGWSEAAGPVAEVDKRWTLTALFLQHLIY